MKIRFTKQARTKTLLAVKGDVGIYLPVQKDTGSSIDLVECDKGTVYIGPNGLVQRGAQSLEQAAENWPEGCVYEGDKIEIEFLISQKG